MFCGLPLDVRNGSAFPLRTLRNSREGLRPERMYRAEALNLFAETVTERQSHSAHQAAQPRLYQSRMV